MAESTPCTTDAAHCVACGRPTELMVGSLSLCCEKRVTMPTTCDGKHPTVTYQTGATDAELDAVLVPHLISLVQGLVASGRSPERCFVDLRRAVDTMEALRADEIAAAVGRGETVTFEIP